MERNVRPKIIPLVLSIAIVVIDQISKAIIVFAVEPVYRSGHVIPVIGDFLRIIHARNPGIAFSIGRDLPDPVRTVLFAAIPIVVLILLFVYYWRSDEFSPAQRWAIAGILGGGAGNLIDRVFRPEGVVDFIDVRIYGLFGMERWPTFNVADASVVVGGITLVVTLFVMERRRIRE
ncbi:MAG: signal peptidase II [Spirochaetaceae bacterium]|nr:MAG: signal peptidase II [Spirochaetaceae bacterium]